jgi:hypothetical protein
MKHRKDYYESIQEQEEKSHKIKNEMPLNPEERRCNMCERVLKLNKKEGE